MAKEATILLDRLGDARIPPGYQKIDSEVAFLSDATNEGQWIIRGEYLCEWAQTFFAGRGIDVQEAFSPIREIQRVIPALTQEQAAILVSKLGDRFNDLPRPVRALDMGQALYGHDFWQTSLSVEHAAEWLLWFEQQAPDEAEQRLLAVIQQQWSEESPSNLRALYDVPQPANARQVLECWLGINVEPDQILRGLGEFPASLPQHWFDAAANDWCKRLVETQGAFALELLAYPLPPALKKVVAREAVDYFTHNPHHLTDKYIKKLASILSSSQRHKLRELLPPCEPSDVPTTPEQVIDWFRREYLPFREWQERTHNPDAHQRVLELAAHFAEWYLGFYPRALFSNDASSFLSFTQTGALREEKQNRFVNLLVVLDGLHQADAQHLLQALRTEARRLTVRQDNLVFAPIPTITYFAKPALLKGLPPKESDKADWLGVDIPEKRSLVERLQSGQPGELFIWRTLEPDHTYHERNTSQVLEHDVEGQLNTIAKKIADLVNQLDAKIALRIILTTDHGRLLGVSQRCVPLPPGMQVHGRAAWGCCDKQFPASGYIRENNIVYVYGDRFGLPDDVAIILDESAFVTSDGKAGSERYAHGGLFPEEVIIPWVELRRDVVPVDKPDAGIQLRITGKGVAEKSGEIDIKLVNANAVPLVLSLIEITSEDQSLLCSFDLESPISPHGTHTEPLKVDAWPSRDQAKHAQAWAMICWPNGECVKVQAELQLEVQELYRRDISLLQDLDL